MDGAGAKDGPQVDAYTAAVNALVAELRVWCAAVDAADPDARADAVAAWEAANPAPPSEYRATTARVPATCYAALRPPPPAWMLEPGPPDPPRRYRRLVPGMSVLTVERFLDDQELAMRLFDAAWLERARAARHAVDRSAPPDAWSAAAIVRADLLALDGGGSDALGGLLAKVRSATPSKGWVREADRLLAGPHAAATMRAVGRWLGLLPVAGGAMPSGVTYALGSAFVKYCRHVNAFLATHGDAAAAAQAELVGDVRVGFYSDGSSAFGSREDHPSVLSEANEGVLRGCVWLLARPGAEGGAVALLQQTALACLVQAPSANGPKYRSLKGLNSCISALGGIGTAAAVTALGRVRLRARDERLSRGIARAMADAAEQAGLTIEDLKEFAVPSHELDGPGCRSIGLPGGHSATLTIERTTEVAVRLRRPDGREAKGTPAVVRADAEAAADLKALKAAAAELERALPVHRLRLERTWLTRRTWTGATFRARLLEHPVMAWFAARLIWLVTPRDGVVRTCMVRDDGTFVDAEGRTLPPLADADTVGLWHPLHAAEPDAVARWRAALVRDGIVQPIKQAHRETYPPTPAEAATATYSNRFAGHLLRQAQGLALARLRGWSGRARIWADVANDEPMHLRIPAHGLAVEYWTEGAGGDEPEVTDNQAYVFLKTDRVRFCRLDDRGDWQRDGGVALRLTADPVPLSDVPAVVFSEAMRDVDLFVSVASIGHDPAWGDAGADAQHPTQWRRTVADAYWAAFNAAELSESARSRREVLTSLVPGLAIADRLRLEERHLVVQGSLHAYRIHLGTANVMLEPDGRYLCIVEHVVAGRTRAAPIWLPFEGDRILSLILSKAVLLVNDRDIADPAIARQL